jgi:hypothetical protein
MIDKRYVDYQKGFKVHNCGYLSRTVHTADILVVPEKLQKYSRKLLQGYFEEISKESDKLLPTYMNVCRF